MSRTVLREVPLLGVQVLHDVARLFSEGSLHRLDQSKAALCACGQHLAPPPECRLHVGEQRPYLGHDGAPLSGSGVHRSTVMNPHFVGSMGKCMRVVVCAVPQSRFAVSVTKGSGLEGRVAVDALSDDSSSADAKGWDA